MSTKTFSITARRAAAKSRNGEDRAYALASSTASSIAVTGDYLTREEFERLFEKIPVEGDEANSFVIKAKASLYTDGYLSAKGPAEESSSGSSGTSGIDLQAMWAALAASDTSKKISNTHLSLYPLTVNGTTYDPSSASAVVNITAASIGALTAHQEIHKLAFSAGSFTAGAFDPTSADASINVPTKTSHLTNDSGYVTSTSLNTTLASYATTTALAAKADKAITITAGTGLTGGGTLEANRTLALATAGTAGTYTKVTTDAYGRVTSGAYPTTLSGYGITDAYTKTEVNTALSGYLPLSGGTMNNTNLVTNLNADRLDGLHAGVTPNSVAIMVQFPTANALVTLGYNDSEHFNVDEDYFKGLCCWAIDNYPYANEVLMGCASPNSSGYLVMQIYGTSGKDEETGLPKYCSGQYTDLAGNVKTFGTYNFTWRWCGGTFYGNITGDASGNAASATKLATARTIWGQSFDGSANVSGALTGVTSITASGSINAANFFGTFLRGSSTNGSSFGDSANILGSSYEGATVCAYGNKPIYLYNNSDIRMIIKDGKVGIGTYAPDYKLDVNGEARVTKLRLGSATIEWDSANSALKVSHSLYSEGWLSAKGAADGSSGSGSTSGGLDTAAMWQALASADTSKKISNTHLSLYPLTINGTTYDPASASATISITASSLGALTAHQAIYDLTFSAGAFSAGTYSPKSAAKTINVPTHTSHLTNNSGFITASASITGNAATATTASNATALGGLAVDRFFKVQKLLDDTFDFNAAEALSYTCLYADQGSRTILNAPSNFSAAGGCGVLTLNHGNHKNQIAFGYNDQHLHTRSTYYSGGTTWKDWEKIAFVTDNVASATALQTSRTLWGQSFDGTGNVSGSLTGVTTISHSGVIAPTSNNSIRLGSADNNYAGVHSRQLINNVSDAVMWLWQDVGQPMAFATNAAERMRITADGYVGIGYAYPLNKLHVEGNATISSSAIGAGGDAYIDLWRGTNASWRMLNSGGTLRFQCNYTTAVGSFFDALAMAYNTGNVGIGTTAPSYKLDVNGEINTTANGADGYGYRQKGTLLLRNNNSYTILSGSNGVLLRPVSSTDATNQIDINSVRTAMGYGDANVGIGTASPNSAYKLHVSGDTYTSSLYLGRNLVSRLSATGGWARGYCYDINSSELTGDVIGAYGNGSTLSYIYLGGTYDNPHIAVPPSGNVGIGTTANTYKLDVNGTFRSTGAAYLNSTLAVTGATTLSAALTCADITSSGNGYFSGWLTAAAAASSSDMRLKRDIRERALTLGEMLAMRPVEFRWIGNGEGSYGAIAQEVEGVCPSLVHTDCQGYKSLAYGNLGVALGLSLARLAKEAISRLDDHEKRISKLETLCQ